MGYSDLEHNTNHVNIFGSMKLEGNAWNARHKRISAVNDPIVPKDVVMLNYSRLSYLNKLMGGTMGGPINMNDQALYGLPHTTSNDTYAISYKAIHRYLMTLFVETIFWELYQRATSFYHFDRASSSQVTYDTTSRKVSKVFDQSLSGNDASQTTAARQPKVCPASGRINNRYFLEFSKTDRTRLISDINLNLPNAEDKVTTHIVYYLKSRNFKYWVSGGLFGHNNAGYDKFVGVTSSGNLVVSGTTGNYIVIGTGSTEGK